MVEDARSLDDFLAAVVSLSVVLSGERRPRAPEKEREALPFATLTFP